MASCIKADRIYQISLQDSIGLPYRDVSYMLLVLVAPLEISECSEQVESPRDWIWLCCGSLGVCMVRFVSCCSPAGYPGQARGERPAGRAPSPAAQWLPSSHHKGELSLSWGAFCTGISQMSSGLTVLIRQLENLAGSPLNYPWCSRMLSGVLPFLPCLRASSFQRVTIRTPWRDPHSWPTWGNYSSKL